MLLLRRLTNPPGPEVGRPCDQKGTHVLLIRLQGLLCASLEDTQTSLKNQKKKKKKNQRLSGGKTPLQSFREQGVRDKEVDAGSALGETSTGTGR